MSLQVLMAAPASGKTQFGVQAVRESLTLQLRDYKLILHFKYLVKVF